MKNLRYATRLTTAFISRFKLLILFSCALGIFIFFAVFQINSKYISRITEKIGITGRYHLDNLPNSILNQIGDGLTKLSATGEPESDIAESWKTSDNGKTWIFNLKDDLYWQDGEKVDSDSIVYEFSDVAIERPDALTIVFKLENPFSPFPTVVAKPTFKQGLLGSGNFTVKDATLVEGYVSQLVLVDKNKNKKIYKFYPTESRSKLAYKLGEVNELLDIYDPKPFDTWSNTEIVPNKNLDKIVTIFFNTQDEFFGDKSARQASIYAIDKTGFDGARAIGPISPNSWAFNSQVKKYSYDTKRTQELIDTLPEDVKNKPIKLVSTPILLEQAEKIAKYWTDLGINTQVQVTSIIPTEFQAYLTIFDTPEDPDQYTIWHTTQVESNISKYSSPRIDKLLEDGRLELNKEERKKIYLDFQRFIVEDSPAAFLYHPVTYTIKRK